MKTIWQEMENDQQYMDIIDDSGVSHAGKFGIWLTRNYDLPEAAQLTGTASIVYASDGQSASADSEYPVAEARNRAEAMCIEAFANA